SAVQRAKGSGFVCIHDPLSNDAIDTRARSDRVAQGIYCRPVPRRLSMSKRYRNKRSADCSRYAESERMRSASPIVATGRLVVVGASGILDSSEAGPSSFRLL